MPAAGPSFYARVYHPAFNIDAEDAKDAVDRFDRHIKAVGRGVQDLRSVFGRVREARVGRCFPREVDANLIATQRGVQG